MHRNSQKRIIESNRIYAITTVTHERFPYFENEILAWLLIAEIKLTKIIFDFKLYAFCILYDHLHLMIGPDEKRNISKIMQYLKRNFSRNANYVMEYADYDHERHNSKKSIVPNEGDNDHCRLPGGHRLSKDVVCSYTKYIETIQKMDKYISNLKTKYHQSKHQLPPFKWQKSFHDHIIRNEKDFYAHYEYITQNYKKHGDDPEKKYIHDYPGDYKFTSINFENMIDNAFE
jgi:REP element-mobilizing transposase RayT